jgi:hypothetical protein
MRSHLSEPLVNHSKVQNLPLVWISRLIVRTEKVSFVTDVASYAADEYRQHGLQAKRCGSKALPVPMFVSSLLLLATTGGKTRQNRIITDAVTRSSGNSFENNVVRCSGIRTRLNGFDF